MICGNSSDPVLRNIFTGFSDRHLHLSSSIKSLIKIFSPPISPISPSTLPWLTRSLHSHDSLFPSLVILCSHFRVINSSTPPQSNAQFYSLVFYVILCFCSSISGLVGTSVSTVYLARCCSLLLPRLHSTLLSNLRSVLIPSPWCLPFFSLSLSQKGYPLSSFAHQDYLLFIPSSSLSSSTR